MTTLRYFDIRGKAEALRMLFEETGTAYNVRCNCHDFLKRLFIIFKTFNRKSASHVKNGSVR